MPFAVTAHAKDAEKHDTATVEAANGVMVRVPVDASGRELDDQAEMRLHNGAAVASADDLLRAWNESVPVTQNGKDDGVTTEQRRGFGGRGFGWGGRGFGRQGFRLARMSSVLLCPGRLL